MKLLTLNTHSLAEENYPEKLKAFVSAIVAEQPDIMALQEVNQSIGAKAVVPEKLMNFTPCGSIPVKEDNHAYNAVKKLSEKGIDYYWTWLGIKKSYGRYEEGISLLCRKPIAETDIITVSSIDDYNNWKTRKIIGVRTEGCPDEWFYSVHFGWWDDKDEPFQKQWKRFSDNFSDKKVIWLMGDFNSPAEVRDEGYDMVKNCGWLDSYYLAEYKDDGITVGRIIDGWKDRIFHTKGMRIDQIWSSKPREIISSRVILNGRNYPVVSDHYGVEINVKE